MAPQQQRKKYRRHTPATIQRVLDAAKAGEDWQAVADIRDVPYSTAWRWIQNAWLTGCWVPLVDMRGGARRVKIQPEHIEHLIAKVEDDCLLTLDDMVDELEITFGVKVVPETVRRVLEGVSFSIKQTHHEPCEMNSDRVKMARRDYVRKIMRAQAQRKRIIYFDETNFNLFCSRNFGWSRRGTRAKVRRAEARGQNLQVIAYVSSYGLEHYELRQGSNGADVIDKFVRALLDGLMERGVSLFDVVLVCDNSSIHNGVQAVLHGHEYVGVEFIKLSPYSPMLNPIENVFSVFKSDVKSFLAQHRDQILRKPVNMAKAEYRMSWLVRAATHSLHTMVSRELCEVEAAHTLTFHADAIEMRDIQVGA